ncbi:hypothetical protein [Dethiothermospora halolimnae]|uniref:hypothetical protein n=1 Tax=Dethiothermospora halolimnae TaxID=3114390 RepID=UPI003CCBDE3E
MSDFNNFNGFNNQNHNNDYPQNIGDSPGYYDVVSVGHWIGLLILFAIPLVNIVGLIYLAVSSENINIKNYSKASLILIGISLVVTLFFRVI